MTTQPDETALWTPSADRVARARLWELVDAVDARWGAGLPRSAPDGYPALHAWSIAEPGRFWASVWDVCGVEGDPGERLVERGDRLQDTRFLPDARLNVARSLLAGRGDADAVVFEGEDGETATLSWDALRAAVARVQAALVADGVQAGDRVAAVVSNRPEGYVLMLATTSIGAVFTSVSPDFGTSGVLDRFAQVTPTVLVGVQRYAYGGKEFDCRTTLGEVVAGLPSLRRAVLVGDGEPPAGPGGTGGPRWTSWDAWTAPHHATEPQFPELPFDQPMYVLYSSGTTGTPKCIVHRAGGILLKHLAEQRFQHDVRAGDRLCFFTTAGWMMWNWQASALGSGATLVLYDGSPAHPSPDRLFDLVQRQRVTHFGTSPRFLQACSDAGLRPRDHHDLSAVQVIFSTGSPLSADGFRYVYDAVTPDVHLSPISGGTDLCGVIVGPDPTGPVHAGQMATAVLGVAADVVDESGRSVGPGERGELVVREAFPSMPLRFWGDEDGSRYRAAYFDRFPGLWHHGDFAERTPEGGYVITGRSDATLNPGGVRIGTAEIYRQVATFDQVVESLAIGQEVDGDTRVVLFVQLTPGTRLDDALRRAIRDRIRRNLSPRHVPAVVVQAPDLPRTRSGKLSELAVRDVVHGRPVANTTALANPESLDFFADVPDLG